jgi:hypothetical protein
MRVVGSHLQRPAVHGGCFQSLARRRVLEACLAAAAATLAPVGPASAANTYTQESGNQPSLAGKDYGKSVSAEPSLPLAEAATGVAPVYAMLHSQLACCLWQRLGHLPCASHAPFTAGALTFCRALHPPPTVGHVLLGLCERRERAAVQGRQSGQGKDSAGGRPMCGRVDRCGARRSSHSLWPALPICSIALRLLGLFGPPTSLLSPLSFACQSARLALKMLRSPYLCWAHLPLLGLPYPCYACQVIQSAISAVPLKRSGCRN